jgi:hypothetical protein
VDTYLNRGVHVIRIRRGRVTQLYAYEKAQACRAMADLGITEASAPPIEADYYLGSGYAGLTESHIGARGALLVTAIFNSAVFLSDTQQCIGKAWQGRGNDSRDGYGLFNWCVPARFRSKSVC